ncbi:MAG: thioredoxin domain-containing protein [Chlamydiales bacterium]|nr:thioredoxin domain-containing protein [Chlamydiales bacterium]
MRHIKSLVVFTFVILMIAAGVIYYLCSMELPQGIALETEGQPTIGYPKARVHVVVFEEPKCTNCRIYNNEVFPQIKKEFIDTNKILYTAIPVSFLPGSMPAALALLCVYYANPDYPNNEMFFKYFDYLYDHQPDEHSDWATPETLGEFAEKTSPAIDIGKLKNCIEMEKYRIRIEKNTEYGAEVMGGVISTPTVYVNGIEVKELTFDGVSKLIREVLAHEGVDL